MLYLQVNLKKSKDKRQKAKIYEQISRKKHGFIL